MSVTRWICLGGFGVVVLACNPDGTCIEPATPGDGAKCVVETHKRACGTTQGSEFFPEDRTAGVLRCKAAGFDYVPFDPSDRDPPKIFYKRKTSAANAPAQNQ